MTADSGRSLVFSPHESARFDLRIFRGTLQAIDIDRLRDEIERERVDIAILRVPARSLDLVARLTAGGLPSIGADTLMHYSLDLRGRIVEPIGVRLRRAEPADRAALESLACTVFDGYVSHYHANPYLDASRILDGYAEWAARHVDGDDGRSAYFVESGGELVGFSCLQIADAEATGVLNGIVPDRRRRGLYRAMLQATLARLSEQRIERFRIATHAHNVAVQRVWMSERFLLERAEATVHVNALRSHGRG